MSTQPGGTGGVVVQPLSAQQARALTDAIRRTLKTGHDLIVEAYQGRAWEVLGYESWDSYCATEFNEARMIRMDREQRQEIVTEMRDTGMSTRAIGSALGVSHTTVERDLPPPSGGTDVPPDAEMTSPPLAPVVGLDGKRYPPKAAPATAPSRTPTAPASPQATGEVDPAPRTPPRRSLTDSYLDAVMELTKAVDRVQRLTADDRFPRNAEQVAAKHHSDLTRAVDVLTDVLNRYPNPTVRSDN